MESFIVPGWCNFGSSIPTIVPNTSTIYVCGETGASDISLAAVLVPVPNPVVLPKDINCQPGDIQERVDGMLVDVPPRPELAAQFQQGVSVGSLVSEMAWLNTDMDLSSTEPYVRFVVSAIYASYVSAVSAGSISLASTCRMKGMLEGVTKKLGEISEEVLATCEDEGSAAGMNVELFY